MNDEQIEVNDAQVDLVTVPQFARLARASLAWAYEKVKSGEIASVRLPGGRLLRIPVSEIKKLRPTTRIADAPALPSFTRQNLPEL
jgi:hypothetical protein